MEDEQKFVDRVIGSHRGRWRTQLELARLSGEEWARVGARVVAHLPPISDVPIPADERIEKLLDQNDGQKLTVEERVKCWTYIRAAIMLREG